MLLGYCKNKRMLGIFLIFFIISLLNCNKSISVYFLHDKKDITYQKLSKEQERKLRTCDNKLSYIPDKRYLEHTPIKIVRINFHFMYNEAGEGNYPKSYIPTFLTHFMWVSNHILKEGNVKMNLPLGNKTPVLPVRYQYEIYPHSDILGEGGVYYHYDDDLYYMISHGENRNNFDRKVIKKYAVDEDKAINIFIMGHHLDSLVSPTYKVGTNGVALGTSFKVVGWYYDHITPIKNSDPPIYLQEWYAHKMLHHEVGHMFGLQHTWNFNDGCDDTPKNPNCYNQSEQPPCDSLYSNNLMDYNIFQAAWTPCQIGTIHYSFRRKNKQIRRILKPTWCTFDRSKTIYIRDTVVWLGAKDLEGHIIIEDGGELSLFCEISLPQKAKISIKPKGRLILNGAILYNDCGDQWKGIEIHQKGNEKGEVVFINNPIIKDVENKIETTLKEPQLKGQEVQ